jgi:phosphoribosylaminoimidazolecarboxamide formyltransferase/IMP cyclohydrolase
MKRALISVSDKTNIVEFSKSLVELGYEIISTGGTKKKLEEAGINPIGISDITKFPEMMDGRVKTLHPNIHGGLLALRNNDKHVLQAKENGIEFIDMVVVNLYPFKETVAKPDVTFMDAIENIDIGGPSMLRSAAKNFEDVTVICDVNDYDNVINELKEHGNTTAETKKRLSAKVFRHTASYDAAISLFLTEAVGEENPESVTYSFDLKEELRYGENPHQKAKFYSGKAQSFSLAFSKQLHGKALSYNNIQDANAAVQIMREFDQPVVVGLKHMNPCGVGVALNVFDAWTKAYEADPVSIFGGIVATNCEVDEATAIKMKEVFLEIIIAPSFSEAALNVLTKKKNLRLLTMDMTANNAVEKQLVSVNGGLLVQDLDKGSLKDVALEVVTDVQPDEKTMADLAFAWKVCKHVKSNAIALAKNGATVGVGAGQMNRVGAAKIALEWAKEHGHNSNIVLASDAFFPFDDVVRLAHQYGVKAIIQPGGSVRDEDSIEACNELGIAMVFTKMRHFKH